MLEEAQHRGEQLVERPDSGASCTLQIFLEPACSRNKSSGWNIKNPTLSGITSLGILPKKISIRSAENGRWKIFTTLKNHLPWNELLKEHIYYTCNITYHISKPSSPITCIFPYSFRTAYFFFLMAFLMSRWCEITSRPEIPSLAGGWHQAILCSLVRCFVLSGEQRVDSFFGGIFFHSTSFLEKGTLSDSKCWSLMGYVYVKLCICIFIHAYNVYIYITHLSSFKEESSLSLSSSSLLHDWKFPSVAGMMLLIAYVWLHSTKTWGLA